MALDASGQAAKAIDAEPAGDGHRGTRAVQRMVEFAPSSGGLALWVHHRDLPEEDDAAAAGPPVFTDGRTLFYRPAFGALPLPEQAGWVAHEVLHVALRHAQRCLGLRGLIGDVDAELFNTCADAIVNSTLGHLAWLALPKDALTLPRLLSQALGQRQDDEAALLEWDVERLYRAVDDRKPRDGRQEGKAARPDEQGSRAASARGDGPRAATARALGRRYAADLRPHEAEAPQDEAEAARAWAERLLRAHAGDGAFSMLRTLLADLPRTRTPWEQVLRTLLARALSPQPALSWSRPARSWLANQGRAGAHRRMPWEPGRTASKAVPRLVVMVDVSGSVDAPLLQRFAREVEALTRRLETALVLVIGDDCVRQVLHFAPGRTDLREVAFSGGGGTDFTPLLEEADRHDPDIGVFLTDLDGPARFKPRWPVVWAVMAGAGASGVPTGKLPFGRLLALR